MDLSLTLEGEELTPTLAVSHKQTDRWTLNPAEEMA